ncbi:MAG: glycosyltransferase, partial [Xanthomonadaceae bacterium]|nr:glycosyltransferase [Xanthomonadaceae bacterium]
MPTPFPASLRIVLYGEGEPAAAWRARLPAVPAAAWLAAAGDDPVGALREGHRLAPGSDLLLLRADAILPPFAIERLLRAADGTTADVVSPLGDGVPALSPLAEGETWPSFDPDAVDRGVALHAARRIAPTRDWLPTCSLWRARALAELDLRPGWCGGALPDGWAGALCDHLFVATARGPLRGPPRPRDPRHPPPAHPLDMLRARFRAVGGTAPARPGFDGRPVVLHVLHGWGGGVEAWVRDLARADDAHCHLALVAHGDTGRRRYGERLALHWPAGDAGTLREWPLAAPIAATASRSEEYRALLAEVVRDYAVDAVVVSSLIGHSLDALASGLPTFVTCHDRYPAWPLLHDAFDDPARRFDREDLVASLARAADSPFADPDAEAWLALRERWLAALEAAHATLVFPGKALRASLLRIEPRLATLAWRVIPHGLPPFAEAPRAWTPPPRARPRVLVLGRVNGAKGEHLLARIAARATAHVDLYLLGCGKAGEAFFGHSGVSIELDYARETLPAAIARIAPDFALLPSTATETFSYTLSELWALGVPPLACATGAFAERIAHGVDGWLVAPNADAVLDGIVALARDAALRDRLRAGAVAHPQRDARAMAADHAALWALPAHGGPRARALPVEPASLLAAGQAVATLRLRHEHQQALQRQAGQARELARRADWAREQERLAADRTRWAQSLQAQIEAERAAAEAERARLRDEAAREVAAALAARDAELAERQRLLESTSWRITAPLRWAVLRLRGARASAAWRARQATGLLSRTLLSLRTRGIGGTLARARQ